jgi:hypothetical protein
VNQSPGHPGSCLKDMTPGSDKFRDIYPQIDWEVQLDYAEQLGLRTRKYELVKINLGRGRVHRPPKMIFFGKNSSYRLSS